MDRQEIGRLSACRSHVPVVSKAVCVRRRRTSPFTTIPGLRKFKCFMESNFVSLQADLFPACSSKSSSDGTHLSEVFQTHLKLDVETFITPGVNKAKVFSGFDQDSIEQDESSSFASLL